MKYSDADAEQSEQFLDRQREKARDYGMTLEEYIDAFVEHKPEPVKDSNPGKTGIDWSNT